MLSSWLIVLFSLIYLALLFFIAYRVEGSKQKKRSFFQGPVVYALSLAVFCTAWTFYGSVGKASKEGLGFLAVYIGPTLISPLWLFLLRKIIRICKTQRITTIADFISSRYGKNLSLASIITVLCFLGVIPYISLQLKAISDSFDLIISPDFKMKSGSYGLIGDTGLIVALCMALFSIVFSTRKVESNEQHTGMVVAVAFESIIKLFAFLAVGVYVTWILFDGFGDVFSRAFVFPELRNLFVVQQQFGYSDWLWIALLSGIAATLLPRQFQLAVVENTDESHLKHATWLFPLYLLLINIFVLPIALSGSMMFPGNGVNGDYFILDIPMQMNQKALALLVFIGGFAAATSMIIVDTIALSTMFSNHIAMPVLLGSDYRIKNPLFDLSRFLLNSRRLGILVILGVAYAYYHYISKYYSLVSVGLISFVSIAQLAPAIIGGLYWKKGNKKGALSGLIAGFAIWFYTLVLPSLVGSGIIQSDFVQYGPWGIELLKPNQLFGFTGFSPITHAFFFSMLFNLGLYVLVSLNTKADDKEQNQAEIFVNIFKYEKIMDAAPVWKGQASIPDMESLLANFFGEQRSRNAIRNFSIRNQISSEQEKADPKLVAYVERVLSGIIGSASARIMVASVVKEEEVKLAELMDILRESQQLMLLNRELKRAKSQLELANHRLKEMDELKDDFLATVTHELRTPITSIRAFSEILFDNPELELDDRQHYLQIINKETERLSRLISQVLDLEKYDSGKQKLLLEEVYVKELIQESINSIKSLADEKKLNLLVDVDPEQLNLILDKDKMMQVLINLLSNAVKFTETGGLIQVSALRRDDQVVLSVKDTGRGIEPEYQELIFNKFFQARNQTIRKPKGSGLGLAICRKIVELHGGTIEVLSEPGKGATFVITLFITD